MRSTTNGTCKKTSIVPDGFVLVLGSSSKSRASVLNAANVDYVTAVAAIDEKGIGFRGEGADPSSLVMQIARAKMDALLDSGKLPAGKNCIVIACDQVVVWKGRIREKPETAEEAREFLRSYSVAPAQTVGATIVVNSVTRKRAEAVDIATQYFNEIPDSTIDKLIAQGSVFHCCGGFMIDDPLLTEHLGKREGDADSIIGLPMRVLKELIAQVV
ncbi:inosine triphosphate pyrophosphatase-like protein [Zopfochytrium polystomum]|nr:inosine triphosphate pyrophosphatase-like protein [Zopfochytrium polystomum]